MCVQFQINTRNFFLTLYYYYINFENYHAENYDCGVELFYERVGFCRASQGVAGSRNNYHTSPPYVANI